MAISSNSSWPITVATSSTFSWRSSACTGPIRISTTPCFYATSFRRNCCGFPRSAATLPLSSSCPSSSTPACGLSASSSLSSPLRAISCLLRGAVTRPPFGTTRLSLVRSSAYSRCWSSCSSGDCPRSPSPKCASWSTKGSPRRSPHEGTSRAPSRAHGRIRNTGATLVCRQKSARSRLQARRRLYSVSNRGSCRSHRYATLVGSAHNLDWRPGGRPDGFRSAVLGRRHHLSPEHWWPFAQQLAGLHPRNLRIDRPWRFDFCRCRHARLEQAAATLSSGLQCPPLRGGFDRSFLSLHRGSRSQVQSGRDRAFPRRSQRPACQRGER